MFILNADKQIIFDELRRLDSRQRTLQTSLDITDETERDHREEIVEQLNEQTKAIKELRDDLAAVVAALGAHFVTTPALSEKRVLKLTPNVNKTN